METIPDMLSFERAQLELVHLSNLISKMHYEENSADCFVLSLELRLKSVKSITALLEMYLKQLREEK